MKDISSFARKPTFPTLWLFAIIFFLTPKGGYCQDNIIPFERIMVEDGLSQSRINCILQDRHGFMWFGTEEGLNCYDGYRFTYYKQNPNSINSISNNWIKSVAEDQFGNLWIGTQGGVSILDKYHQKVVRLTHHPNIPYSLSHDRVLSLRLDSGGGVWVGTLSGLNFLYLDPAVFSDTLKMDPNQFHFLRFGTSEKAVHPFPADKIYSIYEDRSRNIWIGTTRWLVKFDSTQRKKLVSFTNAPQQFSFSVFPFPKSSLPKDKVRLLTCLLEDSRGNFWVGTNAGLYLFDRVDRKFILAKSIYPSFESLSNAFIVTIHEDQFHRLWIGTSEGLFISYPPAHPAISSEQKLIFLQHDPGDPFSLSNDIVLSLFEDNGGVVWVGTMKGLNKYSPTRFKFSRLTYLPQKGNKLMLGSISAICQDSRGIFWIGGANGLYKATFSHDRQADLYTFTHLQDDPLKGVSFHNNAVFTILEDRYKELWIGTENGLFRFHPEQQWISRYHHNPDDPHSLGSNRILKLFEDQRGRLWVGVSGNGLYLFDRKMNHFIRYPPPTTAQMEQNALKRATVNVIFEDREKTLWLGTEDGLYRFLEEQNRFIGYHHKFGDSTSLSNNLVFVIYENQKPVNGKHFLWVGTEVGLNRFNYESKTFTRFTVEQGLSNNVIYGILEDDDGNLWLSTNRGLSKFNPINETFTNYDVTDGLQGNEFNQGAYFRMQNDVLFFGGVYGLSFFNPRSMPTNTHIPQVQITTFRKFDKIIKFNKPVYDLGKIHLSYKDDFFSFEFSALDFTNPGKNRYRYRLEGFDDNWIVSNSRRYASYTNLDGGTYRFHVQGSNNDSRWNTSGASIEIVIDPPPWKTWWAYMLYVVSIVGAFLGYVHWKTKAQAEKIKQQQQIVDHLQRLDQLKDEFLANTSHELRTPLNGIIGITESMLDGAAGKLRELQKQNLRLVLASGRRLMNLINDILDFSRLKNKDIVLQKKPVDLRQITEVVFAISTPLLNGKSIELRNTIPDNFPLALGDENRLQQIMQNLIGNAIKFTEEGSVTVSALKKENLIEVSVADTGIGIPKDKFDDIFKSFEQVDGSISREVGGTGLGLSITRNLVQLHGGSIRVESEPGKGATFTFTLPLYKADEESVEERTMIALDDSPPSTETFPEPVSTQSSTEIPQISNGEFTILVVDDEEVNRQVLHNFLSLKDFSVISANNGIEALEIIHKQGIVPDLVLLDVMMPKMSGYEVCRILRKEFELYELPVLMLTAKGRIEDLVAGLESGANDYLPKPFDKEELLTRVDTLLNLKRAVEHHDELQAIQQELSVARRIQESILPQKIPSLPGLDVYARYLPMEAVGGDYYDFHLLDNDKLGVLMADVSGHGIPAAIIGAMVKIAFSSEKKHASHPDKLLSNMNEALCGKFEQHFVTASYSYIDPTNNRLYHADAGHAPLLIWRKKEQKLLEVKPKGMILGFLQNAVCPMESIKLWHGDRILIYTDGIPECRKNEDEFFEDKEFINFIRQKQELNAQDFVDQLFDYLGNWSNKMKGFEDDLTMVVVDIL